MDDQRRPATNKIAVLPAVMTFGLFAELVIQGNVKAHASGSTGRVADAGFRSLVSGGLRDETVSAIVVLTQLFRLCLFRLRRLRMT